MTENVISGLISGSELDSVYKKRSDKYNIENIKRDTSDEKKIFAIYGKENVRTFKNHYRCKIEKLPWQQFEDSVWCTLYKLGFKEMNGEGNYFINRDDDGNIKNQIDVFAKIGNFICIIECKTSGKEKRPLKDAIDKFASIKKDSSRLIYKQFNQDGTERIQDVWIMATDIRSFEMGTKDLAKSHGIYFVDNWKYYEELSKILGYAARYQFFADVFKNREIPNLTKKVFAIRGEMKKCIYYQFSITPDELMKIAVVAHANKHDSEKLDSYQRLVKPSRLKNISTFIKEKGGMFPTNIVISLSSNNKKIVFNPTSPRNEKITPGELTLPNRFGCAYIIDGQHRLFSYAGLEEATTELLPVIAFQDMDISEQAEMFIEINGEQVKVSKSLLNQIVCNQNWNSEDDLRKFYALPLMTIFKMNGDSDSPLYSKVKMEGDIATGNITTTFAELSDKMKEIKLYGSRPRGRGKPQYGLLFIEDAEKSLERGTTLLNDYFKYFIEHSNVFEDEWLKGNKGFFSKNSLVVPLLGIFKNIITHISTYDIDNKILAEISDKELKRLINTYQEPVCNYFSSMD